jgi:hypothetical protein
VERWPKTQVITTGMVRFLTGLKLITKNLEHGLNVIVALADLWMLSPVETHLKGLKRKVIFERGDALCKD